MTLSNTIKEFYPELADIGLWDAGIYLQDDADGVGAYIREWNYSKPIPDGLTLGKPE